MDNQEFFDKVNKTLEPLKSLKPLQKDPDLVRVVRCRDCRYWEPPTDIEADDGSTMGHCRNDYAPCQNQQTDMDWFCADGEREE